MNRSAKFAMVFLALFSLPFCGFGIAAVVKGATSLASGGDSQNWMLICFGVVFATIGFGLLGAAIFGPRKVREGDRLKLENPDQPWLWRQDWAEGRANSQIKGELIRSWIFCILWNLFSLPMFLVMPVEQFKRQPSSLLALAFPLIGIALVVWAVRETLRWFEFGKTSFQMNSVPCVIGREVGGAIQTHFTRPPSHPVCLKLTCVNRLVTGSGKNQNTQDKILWREEKEVSPDDLFPAPAGTSIPVQFHIPVGLRQTDATDPRDSIRWELEANCDVPGVDYHDVFELPVFRTKDSPMSEPPQELAREQAPPQDFTPTIQVKTAPDGSTEFYFPPARNVVFASGLTGFSVLWGGVLWFLVAKRAPMIFPILFGIFELFMLYGSLQLWLGTSRVRIGSGQLELCSGWLGWGKTQIIPFSEISSIQTAITAQQGGASGTPYYDIQLVRTTGMLVTLGKTIRNKHEAAALALQMHHLIFPKSQAMTVGAAF